MICLRHLIRSRVYSKIGIRKDLFSFIRVQNTIVVCQRSLDQLYVVTYHIKWVKTFWIYSTHLTIILPHKIRVGQESLRVKCAGTEHTEHDKSSRCNIKFRGYKQAVTDQSPLIRWLKYILCSRKDKKFEILEKKI